MFENTMDALDDTPYWKASRGVFMQDSCIVTARCIVILAYRDTDVTPAAEDRHCHVPRGPASFVARYSRKLLPVPKHRPRGVAVSLRAS